MKANQLIALLLGAGVSLVLCSCGGDSHGSGTVPPVHLKPTALAPSDVLARAKSQSETDDPLTVNDGLVSVTPVNDETSDPVPVNN